MATDQNIAIHDLHSLDECRAVVQLQEEVWGRDGETVPASVLMVSAKRGGILLGAVEPSSGEIGGFVWSMPGVRSDGARTHWSHMLAVRPAWREKRLGERLKLAQRERALAQGAALIEWTFDPLQAANAHFNLHVLGAVGATYGVDVYGALAGHLHRGTPTDRLIVEWWIAEPHVERRVSARKGSVPIPSMRSAEVMDARPVIRTVTDGEWTCVDGVEALPDDRRLLVPVPARYSQMQQTAIDHALAWRMAVREVMTTAFGRGYRAVDFFLDRERGGGSYLLAKPNT